MSYVLKLCGWYPSKLDAFSGDFVHRHAQAIATKIPVVALFATKDGGRTSGGIVFERLQENQLTSIIAYYPSKKWFDKWWSQWYYLKIIRMVMPEILQKFGSPTLVHVNIAWKAAIWMHYLRKKHRWPFVVTENSTEYQPGAHLNIQSVSALRQRLTRQLFQFCLRFIPVSAQLGKQVQHLFGPIPFSVVPNAVDTKLFFPAEPKESGPFSILHISTLTYQKNPEGLLSVFDKLLLTHPDIEIVIAGPVTPLLQQWKHAWDVNGANIHCTGMIPYAEVAKKIQASNLLVLFSRYENLPCVILEAHCAGVPVISTNVGGIAEVIDHTNGILVPEGDEPALESAIQEVLLGKIKFDNTAIATAAQQRYNFHAIGEAFIKAYQEAGINVPIQAS